MGLFYIVVGLGVLLLIPTAYAGYIGAPWAPTRKRVLEKAFDEIGFGTGDVLVDIGAGDGKIMLSALHRGARAIGYELSPIMWFVAKVRLMLSGSQGRAHLFMRNFYSQRLPRDCTVVFAFLMPKHMERIWTYVQRQDLPHGRYFLSYAFPVRGVTPEHVVREQGCAPVYIYALAKQYRIPDSDVDRM